MAAQNEEPDLTLMEGDIRNVATIVELTAELRKINEQLDRIRGSLSELRATTDRLVQIERLVVQIAYGLGIRP